MNFKPVSDRVVILPSEPEEKTKGGLLIPESAKETPAQGRVVAVGPGKGGDMMTVHEDDLVLYGQYSGQQFEYEGVKYLIMREEEIFIVIDED